MRVIEPTLTRDLSRVAASKVSELSSFRSKLKHSAALPDYARQQLRGRVMSNESSVTVDTEHEQTVAATAGASAARSALSAKTGGGEHLPSVDAAWHPHQQSRSRSNTKLFATQLTGRMHVS